MSDTDTRPPSDDFEQCVDTIRDIIHECNRHQRKGALILDLVDQVSDPKTKKEYRALAHEADEDYEQCWKGVRPALHKLLEAEKNKEEK